MTTGYIRQSAADIADNKTITAAVFNTEFNSIESAFSAVNGHNHDGTIGGGAKVNLASSVTGTLPVSNGGTGNASFTTNGIVYGAGTGALATTIAGVAGQVVTVGSGGVPAIGAVDLTSAVAVAGALPVTHGGTGGNSQASARTGLGLGDAAACKSNLSALVSPTSVNDSGQGYSVGSLWVNTASGTGYMCVNATAGSAVWKQITA